MADKSIVSNSKLIAIADAIREKTGKSDKIKLDDMPTEIEGIQTGSTESGTMRAFFDARKSAAYLFYNDTTTTSVDDLLSYDDTANVTNTSNMFYGCSKLTKTTSLNFDKVTNCAGMFTNCTSLTDVDTLIFPNATTATEMFKGCTALLNVDNLSFEKVTNASSMFSGCSKLISVNNTTFNSLTNTSNMFYNCSKLVEGVQMDTSEVTDMTGMYYSCSALESVPNYDMSKVTTLKNTFSSAGKLIINKYFNLPSATSLYSTFSRCYYADRIILNADKVYNFYNTFCDCYRLRYVDINSMDGLTSSSNSNYCFSNCGNIKYLIIRNMSKVPSIANNFFSLPTTEYYLYETDRRIYVPDGMVSTLKGATNWSSLADIIYPLSELPNNYDNESYILGFKALTNQVYLTGGGGSEKINQVHFNGLRDVAAMFYYYVGHDYKKLSLSITLTKTRSSFRKITAKFYDIDSESTILQEFILDSSGTETHTFTVDNPTEGYHTLKIQYVLECDSESASTTIGGVEINFLKE